MNKNLEFNFTADSFVVDSINEKNLEGSDLNLKKKFQKNKFQTLYDLGFENIRENESPTLYFLHFLSESFVEILTSSPDLEVARENNSFCSRH